MEMPCDLGSICKNRGQDLACPGKTSELTFHGPSGKTNPRCKNAVWPQICIWEFFPPCDGRAGSLTSRLGANDAVSALSFGFIQGLVGIGEQDVNIRFRVVLCHGPNRNGETYGQAMLDGNGRLHDSGT